MRTQWPQITALCACAAAALSGCASKSDVEVAPSSQRSAGGAAKAPQLEKTVGTFTQSPVRLPTEEREVQIVALPGIGEMRWRCDAQQQPPRFSVALAVPRNGSTITGAVSVGNAMRVRFRADPNEHVGTPLLPARAQTWVLSSRHKPATKQVRMRFRFGADARTLCVIARVQVEQRTTAPSG